MFRNALKISGYLLLLISIVSCGNSYEREIWQAIEREVKTQSKKGNIQARNEDLNAVSHGLSGNNSCLRKLEKANKLSSQEVANLTKKTTNLFERYKLSETKQRAVYRAINQSFCN